MGRIEGIALTYIGWDGDRWDGVRGGMQRGVGREQREGLYVYLQLIHIVTAETNML